MNSDTKVKILNLVNEIVKVHKRVQITEKVIAKDGREYYNVKSGISISYDSFRNSFPNGSNSCLNPLNYLKGSGVFDTLTYESTAIGITAERLFGGIGYADRVRVEVSETFKKAKDAENTVYAYLLEAVVMGLYNSKIGKMENIVDQSVCEIVRDEDDEKCVKWAGDDEMVLSKSTKKEDLSIINSRHIIDDFVEPVYKKKTNVLEPISMKIDVKLKTESEVDAGDELLFDKYDLVEINSRVSRRLSIQIKVTDEFLICRVENTAMLEYDKIIANKNSITFEEYRVIFGREKIERRDFNLKLVFDKQYIKTRFVSLIDFTERDLRDKAMSGDAFVKQVIVIMLKDTELYNYIPKILSNANMARVIKLLFVEELFEYEVVNKFHSTHKLATVFEAMIVEMMGVNALVLCILLLLSDYENNDLVEKDRSRISRY